MKITWVHSDRGNVAQPRGDSTVESELWRSSAPTDVTVSSVWPTCLTAAFTGYPSMRFKYLLGFLHSFLQGLKLYFAKCPWDDLHCEMLLNKYIELDWIIFLWTQYFLYNNIYVYEYISKHNYIIVSITSTSALILQNNYRVVQITHSFHRDLGQSTVIFAGAELAGADATAEMTSWW